MCVVEPALVALLSGVGYKPTVKYTTGTGMGNSLFHRTFEQTSCVQHISLYDTLWGSLCLLSLPVVLIYIRRANKDASREQIAAASPKASREGAEVPWRATKLLCLKPTLPSMLRAKDTYLSCISDPSFDTRSSYDLEPHVF